MNTNTRILLIAPYADQNDVGESFSNYQWVKGITDNFPDVTVLSLHKKGKSIKNHFPNHSVISWPEMGIFSKFERFNAMLKPSYVLFYNKARKWIKSKITKGQHWDLIHQISPLALRYPCPAYDLRIPYIIGPLAGSIEVSDAFSNEMKTMAWYTRLRALDGLRFKFDPLLRKSYQNSALILGVAPYVKEILKGIRIKSFATMTETGILSVHEQLDKNEKEKNEFFKLLYVGRIIRTKGVRDIVRAFKYIKQNTSRKIILDILGDGDDREMCETEAKKLGVQEHIIFHGKVSKETVFRFYKQADLFVFPSFKEPSGNVILEAMSFGLPMIVCSKGGPGYTVKDSFGVKIEPENPKTYPKKIAAAIHDISSSHNKLEEMRKAALREAMDHYLWPRKIDAMIKYYHSVLSGKGV